MLYKHALGAVLRNLREQQARNLRDICEDAYVSVSYLSEVERGRKEASSELLQFIADALGHPLSAILQETAILLSTDELVAEVAEELTTPSTSLYTR